MEFIIWFVLLAVAACAGTYLARVQFGEQLALRSLVAVVGIPWFIFCITTLIIPSCNSLDMQVSFPLLYTIVSTGTLVGFISILASLGFLLSSVLRFLRYQPWRGHYDIGIALFTSIMLVWFASNVVACNSSLYLAGSQISFQAYLTTITNQFIYSLLYILPTVAFVFLILSSNSFTINHWKRWAIAVVVLIGSYYTLFPLLY